jgi:hypothetical protein
VADFLLSVHMPLYRAEEFDYPYIQSIQSILPIADEVHLVVHDTGDGTWEGCVQLSQHHPEKVHLWRHDWWSVERMSECLADATNFGIERCTGRYHLALQADEVVHEMQYATLIGICEQNVYPWVEMERLNFYGSFEVFNSNINRWPRSVVRLAKRDQYPHIRSYGDATHLGILENYDPQKTPRMDARGFLALWHYAYCRKPKAFVDKQLNMGALYGLGEDPIITKWRERGRITWEDMVPANEGLPIPTPHPKMMRSWIEARRGLLEGGWL